MEFARKNLFITAMHRVIASSMNYRARPNVRNDRPCDALVYVLDGGCRYTFRDGTDFTASPGDLVYLAAGSSYTMRLLPGVYSYIYCDFDFSEKDPDSSCRCTVGNPGETEAVVRRLRRAYKRNDFADCMSLLYRVYGEMLASLSAAYVGKGARGRLEESRKRIDRALSDPTLSVGALAEEAGMSEVYYRKLFRTLYHTSPSAYLISARLRAAEELMQYTSLPLKECAARSGFSSVQYFCRIYRKKRGVTPSRWRKENRTLTP